MDDVKRLILGLGLGGAIALTACQPVSINRVSPAAGARTASKALPSAKAAEPPASSTVTTETAPALVGKVKEPIGLTRQTAFLSSLRDALPVSMASGGLGTLALASSLVSNNGGSLISDKGLGLIGNNGGSLVTNGGGNWRLLQAAVSLLPAYTRVRQDVVMVQRPTGLLTADISLYDPKAWNPASGADNEAALIDRFDMKVLTFKVLAPDHGTFDLDLKVVSSRRIPFADKLVLRQEVKKDPATGNFKSERMSYVLGFEAGQADGTRDRVEFELVAEADDLAPALDANGAAAVSYEARRMAMTGTNSHGTYTGEWEFPPGGAILGTFTHTQPGDVQTLGRFDIQPDGSSIQTITSPDGRLALTTSRTAAGRVALELRDTAGPEPVLLPDAASEASGVATFDFGAGEKPRARVF